jgi:hypothetical protein
MTKKAGPANLTGDGGELRTLRDAGVYILALPPADAERHCHDGPHWPY